MRSLAFALLVPAVAIAAPASLPHAGYLLDATDHAVSQVALPMGFAIWTDATSTSPGDRAWPASAAAACNVDVRAGYYAVVLGSECGTGLTTSALGPGAVRWLEVSVNGTALTPRVRLEPQLASVAAVALDADRLGGLDPSDYALATHGHAASAIAGLDAAAVAAVNAAGVDWSVLDNVPTAFPPAPHLAAKVTDFAASTLAALQAATTVSVGGTTPGHLTVTGNARVDGTLSVGGSYVNFGSTTGETGWGLREHGGVVQYKNAGDTAWVNLASPPATVAGSGSDGALGVSGTFNVNTDRASTSRADADGIAFAVSGVTSSMVVTTTTVRGLAAGDRVLLAFLQAGTDTSDVGQFDVLTVASTGSTSVTVSEVIDPTKYDSGTTKRLVLQRIPQYSNVTVTSTGVLTASAFDDLATSSNGLGAFRTGIVAFFANGTLTVQAGGRIDASELGFRGGTTGSAQGPEQQGGRVTTGGSDGGAACDWSVCQQGGAGGNHDGTTGGGGSGNHMAVGTAGAAGQGGGGGASNGQSGPANRRGGNGGGPNGGGGGGGSTDYESNGNSDPGGGGGAAVYDGGTNPTPFDASRLVLGGGASQGGGGGGGNQGATANHLPGLGGKRDGSAGPGGGGNTAVNGGTGANGRAGGGIVFITATTVSLQGSVLANGGTGGAGGAGGGSSAEGGHGGGGEGGQGGAGGVVRLVATSLDGVANAVQARGGAGGNGGSGSNAGGQCTAGAGGSGATFVAGNENGGGGGGGGVATYRACGGGGSGGRSGRAGRTYVAFGTISTSAAAVADPDPYVPADLAEWIPSADRADLRSGDLVSIDRRNLTRSLVRRASAREYDPDLVGIVSGSPDLAISRDTKDAVLVALKGRVNVRVVGDVQAGDPITSSATPGLAMKATHAGRIVGYALTSRGAASDDVTVFVAPQWWNGSDDGAALVVSEVRASDRLVVPRLTVDRLRVWARPEEGTVVYLTDLRTLAVFDGTTWRRSVTEAIPLGTPTKAIRR